MNAVIGIPGWGWKSKLLKYAKKHPEIVLISSHNICYECSRHVELLVLFDKGETDFVDTEYYRYQKSNERTKKYISKKIEAFQSLYVDIDQNGCLSPPVITDDGCRLDGSHRCSILQHLGESSISVNVARYERAFSKAESQKIRNQVKAYRQKVYSL